MTKTILISVVVGLVLVGGVLYFVLGTPMKPSLASVSVSEAPWPAEIDYLKARLAAINLPALSEEGTALHIHQHLEIFVHGKAVPVPSGIGIHEKPPQFISPLHVHDDTGIVHIESPTVEKFTLGQLFDVWGVRLDSACIGAYCADGTNELAVYVNGEKYTGDPRELELTAHAEIVIAYGTPSELPTPIPATYTFPNGL